MARKKPTDTRLTDQAIALADYSAKALVAAGQLRIKSKAVQHFPLGEDERVTIADLPALPDKIRSKLKKNGTITVAETTSIVKAVADSILEGDPLIRLALLVSAKKLIDCLQSTIVPSMPIPDKQSKPAGTVFQFKITPIEPRLRSGAESRSRTARSTSFTSTSKPRWDGPTRTCTSPDRRLIRSA